MPNDHSQVTRTHADVIRAMISPWLVKGIIPAAVVNDVLAELKDAGFKILPREPTIEMRNACTFEAAERDYLAMWDAG